MTVKAFCKTCLAVTQLTELDLCKLPRAILFSGEQVACRPVSRDCTKREKKKEKTKQKKRVEERGREDASM
jgi:hypothetical protein